MLWLCMAPTMTWHTGKVQYFVAIVDPLIVLGCPNDTVVRCPHRTTYILLMCFLRHHRLLTYGLLVAAGFTMAWPQGLQALGVGFI